MDIKASPILLDNRVRWIRQRVALTLDVPVDVFDNHFTNEENQKASDEILSFFSSKYCAGSTIFFSSNKWTEEIEGM